MKTTLLISIFSLLSSHFLTAQSDTLSGVLRDSKEKAIKRYEVRLGSSPGTTVKTDKNGVFVFADANLQDTLYVEMNKTGKTVKVPVSGYTFLTILLIARNVLIINTNWKGKMTKETNWEQQNQETPK